MSYEGGYQSFRMMNGQFWICLQDQTNMEYVIGHVAAKTNSYKQYYRAMEMLNRRHDEFYGNVLSYDELMKQTPCFLQSEIVVKVDRACSCLTESDLLTKRWVVVETEVFNRFPFRAKDEDARVIGKDLSYTQALFCARSQLLDYPGKKTVSRPTLFGEFKPEGHDCWRDCEGLDFYQ